MKRNRHEIAAGLTRAAGKIDPACRGLFFAVVCAYCAATADDATAAGAEKTALDLQDAAERLLAWLDGRPDSLFDGEGE